MKFFFKTFLLALFLTGFFLGGPFFPVNASFLTPEESYTVQLLSTIDEKYAENFVKQLKTQGIEAYLKKVSDARGKKTYRVRTGSFVTQKAAQAFAESELHSKGIMCRVVPINAAIKPGAKKKVSPPAAESKKPGGSPCSGQVSRIFKYRDKKGTLQVTNSPEILSKVSSRQIIEVTVFPVCFSAFDLDRMMFRLETEDRAYRVRLKDVQAGVKDLPRKAVSAFRERLQQVPLRLKYRPVIDDFDAPVDGILYFRSGMSVGLEMVRQGMAVPDFTGLPEFARRAYREALRNARKKAAGGGAVTRP